MTSPGWSIPGTTQGTPYALPALGGFKRAWAIEDHDNTGRPVVRARDRLRAARPGVIDRGRSARARRGPPMRCPCGRPGLIAEAGIPTRLNPEMPQVGYGLSIETSAVSRS